MRKLLFGLTLLLGGMSVSQAQQKIKYVEYDLPNGLHVILHEDHSTPIVAVSVMYHVGSKNEDSTRTGFAHFFEHLMFEGSENIPRGEYSNYVEKAGGALNANTSQDRTFYYDLLPSNQLELGLWLESERMMHAKVDSTGIATQREVVKEEKRQRVDNQPYGSFQAEIMKRAYTVHPYRWTPIGSMADLDAAEEADYVNFYKKFYVPNNACLSIAGDLDIKETKKMINEYFSDIPKGADIVRPTIVEPMKTAQVRDTIYDNIQLPGVMMAFHSPALGTDDGYAMDMVSKILSQGSSSRLHKRIVEDEQKAVFVGAFPFPLEDPGVFIALSIANSGVQPDEVETSIMEEITKLQNELISESEFQKLQNQIENDIVSGYSSQAGIAENLAQYYMYYGSTKLINTEIKKYRAVTRDAIMAVAKKYLIANNSVVLYYLPKQ
ncbi:MAG: zinc protease [Salibacteraceae bacterium]|jgi:zinc protease